MRWSVLGLMLLAAAWTGCDRDDKVEDPLASWTEGAAKQRIVSFVKAAVDPNHRGYIAPADRIVATDNDGTLWCEKPNYFQAVFAFERVKAAAAKDPAYASDPAVKAIVTNDHAAMRAVGKMALIKALLPVHADLSGAEMQAAAAKWTSSAVHPRFNRPYGQLVYQPMLELLDYLRANDFKVFIVTGGGVEFVRGISEPTYKVPKDQVVGSSLVYAWDAKTESVTREPKFGSIDDKAGKPPNIALHIGRRPVVVLGNSDGDLEMLQYADAGLGPSLEVLVHHDDADREYDYDHGTEVALEQATSRNWTIVSIKRDFATVFPAGK